MIVPHARILRLVPTTTLALAGLLVTAAGCNKSADSHDGGPGGGTGGASQEGGEDISNKGFDAQEHFSDRRAS